MKFVDVLNQIQMCLVLVFIVVEDSECSPYVAPAINGSRANGGVAGSALRLVPNRTSGSQKELPNARLVSRILSQSVSETKPERQLSELHLGWGHFILNDILRTKVDYTQPQFIPTPGDDNYLSLLNMSNIEFYGNVRDGTGSFINFNTHFLDGSMIYGSNATQARSLRELSGGRLLTSGKGLPNASAALLVEVHDPVKGRDMRKAGDPRCNLVHWLSFFHTLMVLEHNYWCRVIQNRTATVLSDDSLYEMARIRVIATLHRVTYREYLPALLGEPLPIYTGYNSSVDPRVDQYFAASAARYGHATANPDARFFDSILNDLAPPMPLEEIVGNPKQQTLYGMGSIGFALAAVPIKAIAPRYTTYLRTRVYANPELNKNRGFDLFTADIARNRDARVPLYNDLREMYNLKRLNSISELNSSSSLESALIELYGDINSVEAFAGLLAEPKLDGSAVGELMKAMFMDQFKRLRDGDSYNYLLLGSVLGVDNVPIQRTTVRNIVTRHFPNTIIDTQANNLFFVPQVRDVLPFPYNNEYSNTMKFDTNYQFWWTWKETEICIQVSAHTEGWIGVGFNPKFGMVGLDVIVGTVDEEGYAKVFDGYAKDISTPVEDILSGGTSDIRRAKVARDKGVISLSFCRDLNTTDKFDVALTGVDNVMWAYSPFTSTLSYHADRRGTVNALVLRNKVVESTPKRDRTTLITVIVASVVGAVLVAVIVFVLWRLKLGAIVKKRLNENLDLAYALAEAASNFEIERVRSMLNVASHSKMREAFSIIIDNLERARCNLPDTSFVPVELSTGESTPLEHKSSAHSLVISNNNDASAMISLKVNLQDGLRKTSIACAVVNFSVPSATPKLVSDLLMKLHRMVRDCNGNYNFMAGDMGIFSWGAAHFKAHVFEEALFFGHRVLAAKEDWKKSANLSDLAITCAVSSGDSICGRVCSLSAQLFALYGGTAMRAIELGQIAQQVRSAGVLADCEPPATTCIKRTVGHHLFAGEVEKRKLNEVLAMFGGADIEWMYDLQEREAGMVKWEKWEAAHVKVQRGEWDGVEEVFSSYSAPEDTLASFWGVASKPNHRSNMRYTSLLVQMQLASAYMGPHRKGSQQRKSVIESDQEDFEP